MKFHYSKPFDVSPSQTIQGQNAFVWACKVFQNQNPDNLSNFYSPFTHIHALLKLQADLENPFLSTCIFLHTFLLQMPFDLTVYVQVTAITLVMRCGTPLLRLKVSAHFRSFRIFLFTSFMTLFTFSSALHLFQHALCFSN